LPVKVMVHPPFPWFSLIACLSLFSLFLYRFHFKTHPKIPPITATTAEITIPMIAPTLSPGLSLDELDPLDVDVSTVPTALDVDRLVSLADAMLPVE